MTGVVSVEKESLGNTNSAAPVVRVGRRDRSQEGLALRHGGVQRDKKAQPRGTGAGRLGGYAGEVLTSGVFLSCRLRRAEVHQAGPVTKCLAADRLACPACNARVARRPTPFPSSPLSGKFTTPDCTLARFLPRCWRNLIGLCRPNINTSASKYRSAPLRWSLETHRGLPCMPLLVCERRCEKSEKACSCPVPPGPRARLLCSSAAGLGSALRLLERISEL